METKSPSKRLIILDINGVLCHKYFVGKLNGKEISKLKDLPFEQITLRSFIVFVRPHAYKFLDFCFENFDVGFFSSTTYQNAWSILEKLLSKEQQKQVKFYWYRDRTRLDPEYPKDGIENFDTVKKIKDILESPIVNRNRDYTNRNVVLIDDSEDKTRFNDKKNIYTIKPFDISPYLESNRVDKKSEEVEIEEDMELLTMMDESIPLKFDRLESDCV